MNLEEKLLKSRDASKIDFSKYPSAGVDEPLVKVESTEKILIEPCWTFPNDWEGKYYKEYIATHPEYDGIYVRMGLASRLKIAANSLGPQVRLVVRAGHRPIAVQKKILFECAEDYKKLHPGISDKAALEHARTFVSDPAVKLPPHVCAAAVDVEVLNKLTGELLDFGSRINEDSESSFIYYSGLTQAQKDNRMTLLTAMLDAGFASCTPEWWHYSYGDQAWAWFYGKSESLYSPLDL